MKLKKSSTDASEKEASSKEKSKEKKKPLTSFQSKYYSNPTFDKKVSLFWIYYTQVQQFHKSLKGITAESLTGLSPDLSNLSEFLHSTKHEVILKRAGQNMDKIVSNYLEAHKRVFVEVGQYVVQLKNLKAKVKRRNQALAKFTKWKTLWEQIDPKDRQDSKNGKKVAKAKASLEKYDVLFSQVQAAVEDELTLVLLRRFKDLDTYLEKLCRAQKLLFSDLMSTWGTLITFQFRLQNEEAAQGQPAAATAEDKPEDNMYESQKVVSSPSIRASMENRYPSPNMVRSPSFPNFLQEEKGRTASSSSLSVNELIPQDQSDTPLSHANAFFGTSETISNITPWGHSGGFLEIWDPFKDEKKDKQDSDSDESVLSTTSGATGTEFTNSPFTSPKHPHFNAVDSFDSQFGAVEGNEDMPSTPVQEFKSPSGVNVKQARATSFGGPDDHFSTRFSVHFANTSEIFTSTFGNTFDEFRTDSATVFGTTDSVPDSTSQETPEAPSTQEAVKEVTFAVDYAPPTEAVKEHELQIFEFPTAEATAVEFNSSTVTPLPETQDSKDTTFQTGFAIPSTTTPASEPVQEVYSSSWEFSVPPATANSTPSSAPAFLPIDEIDVDSDSDLDIDWNDIFYKPQSTPVAEQPTTTTFDQPPVFATSFSTTPSFTSSIGAPPLPVRKNSIAFADSFSSSFDTHFDFEKFKNDPTEIPALPPKPTFTSAVAPTFEPTFYQPPQQPISQSYNYPTNTAPPAVSAPTAPVSYNTPAPVATPVVQPVSRMPSSPALYKTPSMGSLMAGPPTPKPSNTRNIRRTLDTSKQPTATVSAPPSNSFSATFDFAKYSETDPEISPTPSPRISTGFTEAPSLVISQSPSSSAMESVFVVPAPQQQQQVQPQMQQPIAPTAVKISPLPSPRESTSFSEAPPLTATTSGSSFSEPFNFAKYSETEHELSPVPSPRGNAFSEAPALTASVSTPSIEFGGAPLQPSPAPLTRTASMPVMTPTTQPVSTSSSFSATFDFAAYTAPSTSPSPSLTPSLAPPSSNLSSSPNISPSSSFGNLGGIGIAPASSTPAKPSQPQQPPSNLGSSFSATFDFDAFNKNNNTTPSAPAVLTPTPSTPVLAPTPAQQPLPSTTTSSSPSSFSATFDFDKFSSDNNPHDTPKQTSPAKIQLTRSFEQMPVVTPPRPAFNMSASMSMSTLPISVNRPNANQMYSNQPTQPAMHLSPPTVQPVHSLPHTMQPQPMQPMQQPIQTMPQTMQPMVMQNTSYMQQPMYPQQMPSQPMYMTSPRQMQQPVYPTPYQQYPPQYPQAYPVYPNAGMPNMMYNIPQPTMMMGGMPMQQMPQQQPPQGFNMVRSGPTYPAQSPSKPQGQQNQQNQSAASSALQW